MNQIKKFFSRNLKPFIYSSSITGCSIFIYFYYLVNKNKTNYLKLQTNERFKDTTRTDYEFFGLNWGAASDKMIKDIIDSGDLIFIKYDCNECLSIKSLFQCYINQIYNNEQEYDNIGIAFRDSDEQLFILFNNFGKAETLDYANFISLPYLKEVSFRKMLIKDNKIDENKKLYKTLKDFINEISISNKNENENIINQYFEKSNICLPNNKNISVTDYDSINPFFFNKNYSLGNKIIIRSNLNKNLME